MKFTRTGVALSVLALCIVGWVLPTADAPNLEARLSAPHVAHWAGTDHLGRDVLSRSLQAMARTSAMAVPAWALAVGLGALLGMGAAIREKMLFGRVVDWGIRIVFTTPLLLVLVSAGALIGRGFGSVFLVVVLLGWAYPARHARAVARDVLGARYTQAALAMGFPPLSIVTYVLAPTCLLPVIAASGGLLVEIMALDMALSLFGFGPPPPAPTLGTLLNDGLRFLSVAPWMVATPLMIVCCVCVGVRWFSHRIAASE